ncbi:MAG TPA: hypothetical protein VN929_17995 [Burkholderiales bacterium]|nr:hypothetical protein [Burkholderiales bacterium]
MSSTLLLVQFASQNVALFCCALFAGAATYVSLVEHPAMDEGGTELADTYVLASHPRPAIFQTSFGVIGSLAAMLAGLAGGTIWWLAGGMVLGAAALLQLLAVMPLTRRFTEIDARADPKSAAQMIARLVKLHATLSLAALASLFMFIAKA